MASGKDLRRRITSVKNTQQITKAMKLVAAARLKRSQDAIMQARPYAAGIRDVVAGLARSNELREQSPLLAKREAKTVNVVLVTSDRGLCGSFNAALLKKAEQMYKAESGKYQKFVFTCIGKKGYEYLNLRKIPVQSYKQDFFRGLKAAKAYALADELMESFLSGEFDEVRMIFSEFKSAISQVPTAETLLPITPPEAGATAGQDFLFEPSKEAVLAAIPPRYFRAQFYRGLLESVASEHGARMAAMDSATKNAGEMIKKLTQEYNRVRQAGITKELLEIVSGAEALK